MIADPVITAVTGAVLLAAIAIALLARTADAVAQTSGGAGWDPLSGGLAIAGLFALPVCVLLPGLVHQHGFDALIPLTGATGGLLLLLVLIGPALARAQSATLPALVGRRFGRTAQAITLVVSLLATGGLLLGVSSAAISLATRLFSTTVGPAALGLAAAVACLALPGGLKSVLAASRAIAVLAGTTLLLLLAIVCTAIVGNPVGPLAYGEMLRQIGPAEMSLIESGSVDFGVFKPFLREFLTVDRLNWALLALTMIAAIAALPTLVQSTGAFARSTARRGLAWATAFLVIALTMVPAIAAVARLETYRAVSSAQNFNGLPDWIRRASALGAVHLHGTSLGLVETVARDVSAGASSIDAVSAAMADRGPRAEALWQRLDPAVQQSVLDLAQRFAAAPGSSLSEHWTPYVDTVVTAAAAAAGNMSGKPDLAAIALDPQFLVLALPKAAGLPDAFTAIVIAIVLAAAAVLAAALVSTLSSQLVRDGSAALAGREPAPHTEVVLMRVLAVGLAIAFALTAALVPVTADVVFVVSLSLAAAALFPALVLTLWWSRTTATGFVAAIVTGLAVGTYYLAGTAIYSISFYEAWPTLSNAGPDAFAEYEEARELWVAAAGDDRAAAYADLAARTTGSLWSPGLANWFGIAPAAAPVLAIPAALLAGCLVSLLGGARREDRLTAPETSPGGTGS